jgi:hypothetical protein
MLVGAITVIHKDVAVFHFQRLLIEPSHVNRAPISGIMSGLEPGART